MGDEATGVSLDGRRFRMESSTASRVDPVGPTVFDYFEAAGVVWGAYRGDTVVEGRFVGTRVGTAVRVSFVHALAVGGVVEGTAASRLETRTDGSLRLVEDFDVDGVPQRSVCVEIPPE